MQGAAADQKGKKLGRWTASENGNEIDVPMSSLHRAILSLPWGRHTAVLS
ncbi:hypothetical protein ACP_3292 [Acidobacterium capsulatum ATCC 51196]|uniref:Uncharacterized protein n=1 Tax=Acidobacterium capsulatum (strain ATCC 51196 / DSM 11244 / BCRC 80197 / JCM 7670 / NBRC 15755 / NCIMB 13165 / 161) TaxID=240015 RepID=C1F5V6_ACIC5|nr:hypothetical protein ACP_3292 [Acidobacterium capsulatum ATCC 51196]